MARSPASPAFRKQFPSPILSETVRITYILSLLLTISCTANANDHSHNAPTQSRDIKPPKVFLDKSPRIVAYQLKRLDNDRLLLVERQDNDEKYIPVYEAILSRNAMSPQHREEAIKALAKLRRTDIATEALAAIGTLKTDDRQSLRTARALAELLLAQPQNVLQSHADALTETLHHSDAFVRSVGMAGLIHSNAQTDAWSLAQQDESSMIAWLSSISLLTNESRDTMYGKISSLVDTSENEAVRTAAIRSIGFVTKDQQSTFKQLTALVADERLRPVVVRTLLKVPRDQRTDSESALIVSTLVELAEKTPAEKRTTDEFVDAMQLADQLMANIPKSDAKAYRNRLREVTVRVVRIKTVEEEMRYDVPYFAVEAGRPVQIVLENHDLMPHNLVVSTPGSLKEVAQAGLVVGSNGGWKGLAYVPESDKVLAASKMIQPDKVDRITFDAPSMPGEYPYVCTFPQHWYRMYGVMVVVEDLDAWLKNPTEPANPLGSNRSFVQAWTLNDFKGELELGLRGRSTKIGEKIFTEASCKGCHKAGMEGGLIGPELNGLFSRWKGDAMGVLREVLEPSHKVDSKYAMYQVLTVEGRVLTGIILAEDDDKVTLLENPEAKNPTVVLQDDIEEMVKSPNSMMPKGLMNQYTKDEVFEMMAYLKGLDADEKE